MIDWIASHWFAVLVGGIAGFVAAWSFVLFAPFDLGKKMGVNSNEDSEDQV